MTKKEIVEEFGINQNVILKLYKDNIDSKRQQNNEYGTLNDFRNEMKLNGSLHRPYDSMHAQLFLYRVAFFGLGILFFTLTILIYKQSINWFPYSFIFSNSLMAKNSVLTACFLLSLSAFGLSYSFSTEKEALHQFVKRTRKKLTRIYNKQNYLIQSSQPLSDLKRAKKLKQLYKDALDKVTEIEEVSILLLNQITEAKYKEPQETVKLYNEALLESNDHLHLVVNQFKKTTLFF